VLLLARTANWYIHRINILFAEVFMKSLSLSILTLFVFCTNAQGAELQTFQFQNMKSEGACQFGIIGRPSDYDKNTLTIENPSYDGRPIFSVGNLRPVNGAMHGPQFRHEKADCRIALPYSVLEGYRLKVTRVEAHVDPSASAGPERYWYLAESLFNAQIASVSGDLEHMGKDVILSNNTEKPYLSQCGGSGTLDLDFSIYAHRKVITEPMQDGGYIDVGIKKIIIKAELEKCP
jgi:hypothetical protein